MPPVTPSPHRFLSGQRRQPSPPKDPKPLSALRRQAPILHERTPRRSASSSSASQFAQTPRFSFGRPAQVPARTHSPPRPSIAQALHTAARPVEDVEDTREPEVEHDEMLFDMAEAEAVATTEQSTVPGYDEPTWSNDLPYSPKRRRLNQTQADTASPAAFTFRYPDTPASHLKPDPRRFTRAGSVASTVNEETSTTRRPAFLKSSLAQPEQLEPLPEAFSPRRRGEKFVPGGMAATMQQWAIEVGQSAASSRRGQGYLRGEDYVLRVRTDSASGAGPLLVHGRQPDGTEVRLMLVADSKNSVVQLPEGCVVGVRAPTWEVMVGGGSWTVGVDWKVLQE